MAEARIDAIYSAVALIGTLLETITKLDHSLLMEIHFLFTQLLTPSAQERLSVLATKMLTLYLPKINQNRELIEKYYRPRVLYLLSLPDAITSAISSRNLQLFCLSKKGKAIVSQLLSLWTLRPLDEVLLAGDPHLSDTSRVGYALRRKQWLESTAQRNPVEIKFEMLCGTSNDEDVIGFTNTPFPNLTFKRSTFADEGFFEKSDDVAIQLYLPQSDLKSYSAETLSMSMPHGTVLVFSKPPFSRQIFVNNRRSDSAAVFHVQVWPAKHFYVVPNCGEIPPNGSFPIIITFDPLFRIDSLTNEVEGYIRLRDRFGFPLVRYSLRGTTMPYIHCPIRNLNFGHCPLGEPRVLTFPIINLTSMECSVNISLLELSTPFQVIPSQIIIPGKDVKLIKVRFSPTAKYGLINSDTLIVESDSNEKHSIEVHGVAKSSFSLLSPKVDFGQIDMFWGPSRRVVVIQNNTTSRLPVYFHFSTKEFKEVENQTLLPLETKSIPVYFSPSYRGTRRETIYVVCPFGSASTVDVTAISGRTIQIPIQEEIFLLGSAGDSESLHIPVVSMLDTPQRIIFKCEPILKLRSLESKKYNPDAISFDLSSYSKDLGGYKFTISSIGTAVLEVSASFPHSGCYETTLKAIQVDSFDDIAQSSRRVTVSLITIRSIVVSQNYLTHDNFISDTRKFLGKTILASQTQIGSEDPSRNTVRTNSCFEIEPSTLTIHGTYKFGDLQCNAAVSVSNITNQSQPYKFIYPLWISINVPNDGTIPALSALDIHVSIQIPREFCTQERFQDLFYGFFAVVDDRAPKSFAVCRIEAVPRYPLVVEVHPQTSFIQFPNTKVLSKLSKKFFIRNCLPIDGAWEGRLFLKQGQKNSRKSPKSASKKGFRQDFESGEDGDPYNPFSLVSSKIVVKPFSFTMIEVAVQATGTGHFYCEMEYDLYSFASMGMSGPRFSFIIGLFCDVGKAELTFEPDTIVFQDTNLGGVCSSQILTIENMQQLQYPFRAFATHTSISIPSIPSYIARRGVYKQQLEFLPKECSTTAGFLFLSSYLWSAIVPFYARGGNVSLKANKDIDILGKHPLLDCGDVVIGKPKTIRLTITNFGTLHLIIHSVSSEPAVVFQSEIVVSSDLERRELENFENLESEIDWDEIDHLNEPPDISAQLMPNKQATARTVRRRDRKSTLPKGTPSSLSCLPILLQPGQSFIIELRASSSEVKQLSGRIKFKLSTFNGSPFDGEILLRAQATRSLLMSEKHIDFGLCDALHRHIRKTKIINASSSPMQWKFKILDLCLQHPKTQEVFNLRSNHNFPVTFIPPEGLLLPSQHQVIEVAVHSNLPFCEITAHCLLVSDHAPSLQFSVHAIASVAKVTASCSLLDFGVLAVGKTKKQRVSLCNSGGIPCKFTTNCNNPAYLCDPDQGVIDGGGLIHIDVVFCPENWGIFNSTLQVKYSSTDGYFYPKAYLGLKGSGGYPNLQVETKEIDFGTAILGNDNVQFIHVHNKGDADAQVSLSSYHPCIFLEAEDVVIAPKSLQNIAVIYRPSFVENLHSKLFLKSADSRSDVFLVKVKGKVGVSRLSISPFELFQNMDFGTCLVMGVYPKNLTVKNTGNILVSFSINLTLVGNEPNPFTAFPISGSISEGEEIALEISFRPQKMMSYVCKLEIKYDHYKVSNEIRGTGGQMMISILPSPEKFDFGLCRMDRIMQKEVLIENKGNIGIGFQAFIIEDTNAFTVVSPSGFCRPFEKTPVPIKFIPQSYETMECTLKVLCGKDEFNIKLSGSGSIAKLTLCDADGNPFIQNGTDFPTLDLGIHPLNTQHQVAFKLVNSGLFGLDFFLEPFRALEFSITPQRGYIYPNSSTFLTLTFSPEAENVYMGTVNILWESKPIRLDVRAAGGVGKLDIRFISQSDLDQRSLDFGMIPVPSFLEKRFYIVNQGLVEVSFEVTASNPDFAIVSVGDPISFSVSEIFALIAPPTKRLATTYVNAFTERLKPKHAAEISVRYSAKQQIASKGTLSILSEGIQINLGLRGKGGTISISHRGTLVINDIAVRHTASRKITYVNSGSITSILNFGWKLLRNSEMFGPYIELSETYGTLDPRNGWPRLQLFKEFSHTPAYKVTAKDRWWMLRKMVYTQDPDEDQEDKSRGSSTLGSSLNLAGSQDVLNGGPTSLHKSSHNLFKGPTSHLKKKKNQFHSKRRKLFFSNISSLPATSQELLEFPSFVRVNPQSCLIPGFGEVEITVEINLPTEETFLASLVCVPSVPNTSNYEVSLSASAKIVSVVMDDSRAIDFGCQQFGHREIINRVFTNVGHRPFSFTIEQDNRSLTVFPNRGFLDIGQSILVQFAFEATEETPQNSPILFIPDCSQAIKLKAFGSGGNARMSLYKYKRFDFGHCMIGKETFSSLPISNEGNAILHLNKFDLIPSDTFFKGADWPEGRVSVKSGDTYNLPLVFNPQVETPSPGKLIVGNDNEWYDIQLTGFGREAVLIVTKVTLDFTDCLIGNSYSQKLGLKNVGDVNYPVVFKLEATDNAVEFVPPKMLILPFSESFVQVIYKPVKEQKTHTSLLIESPYSTNTIPMTLHSGFARLSLSEEVLDFGMFEKSTRAVKSFSIRNTGSVNIAYSVIQSKPHSFMLTNPKGMVLTGRDVLIGLTYIASRIGSFCENLVIKTELQSAQLGVKLVGQCEESIVKPEEFHTLNMGTCPVFETSSKTLTLRNYGKFALSYQIKSVYPIKIAQPNGEVPGESANEILVHWNPSGGYELRTQLIVVTNIGTFQVTVRGKATFPELVLKENYFDFGVCAVGHAYSQNLELFNKGKVPLHWSIPNIRDSYTVSVSQGTLGPKEVKIISIVFRPMSVGRYGSSFIIESKGLNFKEVALVGIGGIMAVDIPTDIDLGQCPCDYPVTKSFSAHNKGDVPLHLSFERPTSEEVTNDLCSLITIPLEGNIQPGKHATYYFSVRASAVGQFEGKMYIKTKEKTYTLIYRGRGVRITLKSSATDQLPFTTLKNVRSLFPHIENRIK
jgi:hypothetical protein